MMKLLKSTAVVLILASLGCGLHQDPLTGKDQRFRDGTGKPTDPIYEKPVDSDAFRWNNTPDSIGAEEDTVVEFEISARILLPDYVVQVRLDNLNEFPGATFDASTGKFKWKPARGFVNANGGTKKIERELRLVAIAKKPNGIDMADTKTIKFTIDREYTEPIITLVRKDANVLREGNQMYVRIRVRDNDANDADRNTWPKVTFSRTGNTKSLSGQIDLYSQDLYAKNEYELIYRVDLLGAEVTDSGDDFTTTLTAESFYGKRSASQTMTLTVFTSLSEPVSSWSRTQDFKVGETRKYQFVIFDPKQEGRLSLAGWRDVPQGAQITCNPSTDSVAILICDMEWTPTEDQASTQYSILASVQTRNTDNRDASAPTYSVYLSYRVSPANFIPAQKGK